MLATTDLRRTAVAILGAAVFSATCVFGAVGPARAEAPVKVAAVSSKADCGSSKDIVMAARPILM